MELRLTLKGPERLMGARREARLAEGAMVIGRGGEADWPIPDPDRVLSKAHCRIECDFSGFHLTDTSTNGVRVNDEPVGYGLTRRVESGDVILLGDAVLVAQIAEKGTPALTDPSAPTFAPVTEASVSPAAGRVLPSDGPFGAQDAQPPLETSPAEVSAQGMGQTLPAGAKGMVLDDWWAPDDADEAATPTKTVDIFTQGKDVVIGDTHARNDTLWSQPDGVASLARIAAGLDVNAFSQAVETAALVLPEGERRRFLDRLLEVLRGVQAR